MKLACGDHSFPLLEHESVCALVRMLGFSALDLGVMGNRSHIRPEIVRKDLAGWAGRISERLAANELELADLFLIAWSDYSVMAVNHPDESERSRSAELFTDMVEFATRLGAPGITMLPGMEFAGVSHEDSMRLAARELAGRVSEAHAAGLRLSIEAHTGSLVEDPEQALQLVEMTPGLQVTLDHTHFVRLGHPQAAVAGLVPYTRHYHARGARQGRLQARMQENTIDFEAVVDELSKAAYDGYLAVEFVWTDWEHCNECDNVSETILLRDRLMAHLAGKPWTPHVSTI